MDLGLRGQTALVAAASKGLGKAIARAFVREGARVAICARDAVTLTAAAAEIGGDILAVPADVTKREDVDRFVQAALDRFGRIDVLVNNAGTSAAFAFDTVDDGAWQADLELKLFAAIRCIRLCLPAMRRAGGGRIINILNTAAKEPPARSVPTSVTRAAGMALTKALSKELAPERILVNAICIGLVKSSQWERRWEKAGKPGTLDEYYATIARDRSVPVARIAEASELAALVAFLASEPAAYITGVAINFDGGMAGVL